MVDQGGITLITCTGGRPEAFALCERWMGRQTLQPAQWIVVDDCESPTQVTMGQEIVRPEPFWSGESTLCRNILAAIPLVRGGKVFFIEDDDYYKPEYLATMAPLLNEFPIVGQIPARYYNVKEMSHRTFTGAWASLCQTAMDRSALNQVAELCKSGSRSLDVSLWVAASKRFLFRASQVVGVKGMPGRAGLGVGHHPNSGWSQDDGSVLKSWFGDDAIFYQPYLKPCTTPL